jgi:molecular chaperone GrpE
MDGTDPSAPGVDTTADVGALRRELDEQRDRYLRLRADLDNFHRRAAAQHATAHREGRRMALAPILPVLDALERALATGSTDADFYEGVAAIHRMFLDALRSAGVEPLESEARPFDPAVHEAVATTPPDGQTPGTVAREVRRGYRLDGDLLRPAQVVVVASEEAPDRWR